MTADVERYNEPAALASTGAAQAQFLCVTYISMRRVSSAPFMARFAVCAGVELCGLPGQQFRDPWSLLQDVQGLATRPTLPCNRARDAMLPPTHWGLADDAVKAFMLLKARQWGMDVSDSRQ